MLNLFSELQFKNERYTILKLKEYMMFVESSMFDCSDDLSPSDLVAARAVYAELQEHTHGLCRGGNSLPVLAVELQNSCHLLQVHGW